MRRSSQRLGVDAKSSTHGKSCFAARKGNPKRSMRKLIEIRRLKPGSLLRVSEERDILGNRILRQEIPLSRM